MIAFQIFFLFRRNVLPLVSARRSPASRLPILAVSYPYAKSRTFSSALFDMSNDIFCYYTPTVLDSSLSCKLCSTAE